MLTDFSVYLVTWNVVGRPPAEDLQEVLGLTDAGYFPDVFAIGLQEVNTKPQAMLMGIIFEDPWCKAFREALAKWDYIKLKMVRLRGLLLVMFTRRKHLTHIRGLQVEYTRTGLGGVWGNKGGVTIRANVYGCSLCVINCHLAAHDHQLKQRIEDYNSILDGQFFSDPETENILYHDYIFWIGDLNFRLDGYTAQEISNMVDKGQLAKLLERDQLRAAMASGEAFSEFQEAELTFEPSYKFSIDTSSYDLDRRPGWTDRILYKVNPDVYEDVTLSLEQKSYRSHPGYTQSDHKPVSASFNIKVFEDYADCQVEILPIDKWFVGEDSHCFYVPSGSAEPTNWDWIGVFKADFSSLEDYVTYVWAAPRAQDEQQVSHIKVTFPEIRIAPGQYCLLYVCNEFGNVLGMSKPFEVAVKQ